MKPRGVRNNNPGNIKLSNDAWKGLASEQKDEVFFTFAAPRWGIRAMARVLLTYQESHGLKTLAEIVNRWAPPTENDSAGYAKGMSRLTGFELDEPLDLQDYPLIPGITPGLH